MARFTERRRGNVGLRVLDLDFANQYYVGLNSAGRAFPVGWSFTRTDTDGTATALDLAGNVIPFASGVPRITNRGLLVEEGRTNLFPRSQEFNDAVWSKTNATVTANATTAPDGAATADKIEETSATGFHGVTQIITLGAGAVTLSAFVKSAERTFALVGMTDTATGDCNAIVNLTTGAVVGGGAGGSWTGRSVTVTAVANGFWWVTVTGTKGASASVGPYIRAALDASTTSYAGTTGSGIFAWQADLQAASSATSPIITTGAAGTRGAEIPQITGLGALLTPPFTAITEWNSETPLGGFPAALGGNNFIYSWSQGDSVPANRIGMRAVSGNVNGPSGTSRTAGLEIKHAVAFDGTAAQRQSVNGASVQNSTLTLPAQTLLNIGRYDAGTPANGYIRRIRILPRAVSDAELVALTAP